MGESEEDSSEEAEVAGKPDVKTLAAQAIANRMKGKGRKSLKK